MVMWLNDIASRYNFVSLKVIGKSVEGRPIHVVTINDHLVELPIILLEGGAHSREWIATASILYLIEKLAGLTGKGSCVVNYIEQFIVCKAYVQRTQA